MLQRYVKSKRHTMQVDFDAFMAKLKQEMVRSARRATATGNRPAVAARVRDAVPAASSVPRRTAQAPCAASAARRIIGLWGAGDRPPS